MVTPTDLSSWPAGTGCRLGLSNCDRDQVIDSLEAGEVDPDDPGVGSPVVGEAVALDNTEGDPPCILCVVAPSLALRAKILPQYSLIWNGLVSLSGSPTSHTW